MLQTSPLDVAVSSSKSPHMPFLILPTIPHFARVQVKTVLAAHQEQVQNGGVDATAEDNYFKRFCSLTATFMAASIFARIFEMCKKKKMK